MRASRVDPATYEFAAPLWEWPARAAWFFVTVPVAISDEIDARTHGLTKGFAGDEPLVRLELVELS